MMINKIAKTETLLKEQGRQILEKWNNLSYVHNTVMFNEWIGVRLRLARLSKGLTQDNVAKRLNTTFQQIQKYEKATNKISFDKLLAFCEAFDVDLDFFLRPLRKLNKKIYVNGKGGHNDN